MTMLTAPLETVEAYVAYLLHQDIPVLRQTIRDLAALQDAADSVNGKRIAGIVLRDPLMTLKLLAHLQAHRSSSQNHDITTIDRAIMMMGISPFFTAFAAMPTLENALSSQPKALMGVLQLINRARKASHFARDWAIVRHDLDVDEITVAALLSEATEIMCWTFAPTLALAFHQLRKSDPGLRSSVAFQRIFRVDKSELESGVAVGWQLPELLMTLLDESQTRNPRVQNVRLANNFSRHLANGWNDPALPDDIADLESLLHLSREQLLLRLGTPAEHMERFMPQDE